MEEMLWIILIPIVVVVLWLISWIRGVKAREVAGKMILNKLVGAIDSGIYFIPRFFGCGLIKVSTKQFKVKIPTVEVYTKPGEVNGKKYGTQPIKVDSTLYLFFPQPATDKSIWPQPATDKSIWKARKPVTLVTPDWKERLLRVLKAKIPTTEEGLSDHFKESVQGIVRAVVGGMVWEIVTENIERIREEADKRFKAEESVLKSAGFADQDFSLVIEKADLPPEFRKLLSLPDEERLNAEAADSIAQKRILAIGGAHRGIKACLSRNLPSTERDEMTHDYLTRQMSLEKGVLHDNRHNIRVEGASGIEKAALNIAALLGELFGRGVQKPSPGEEGEKKTAEEFTPDYEKWKERREKLLRQKT